jgi:hypothetical protein
MTTDELSPLIDRLDRIESVLLKLTEKSAVREWYSVEEFAASVGKAAYTIREHCRLGRLNASKRGHGHGLHQEWVIAHSELIRFQKDGLLPERR